MSRRKAETDRELSRAAFSPSYTSRRMAWAEGVYLLLCLGASVAVGGGMFDQWAILLGVVLALPCIAVMMKRWASRPTRIEPVDVVLTANVAVVALSCIWSVYHWASLLELLKAVALAGLFDGARRTLGSREGVDRTARVVFWGGVALAAAGSSLYLLSSRGMLSSAWVPALQWLKVNNAGRLGMPFAYANTLAAYLLMPISIGAVLVFLCPSRRGRLIYTGGLLFLLFGVALTESRGGILVLGLVALALPILGFRLGLLSRPRLKTVVVVYVGLLAAVGMLAVVPSIRQEIILPVLSRIIRLPIELMNPVRTTADAGGRVAMIGDALRYFSHYPVFGSGAGTYSSTYMLYRATMLFSSDPHSVVLQTLTELGLVGLAVQAALLWITGSMMTRRARVGGREGTLVIAILVGAGAIILHAFIDWDFKFFAIPVLLAVTVGSAVGIRREAEEICAVPAARLHRRSLGLRGAIAVLVTCAIAVTAGLALSADLAGAAALRRTDGTRLTWLTTASYLNRLDAVLPFQQAELLARQASLAGGTDSVLNDRIMALYEKSSALDSHNALRLINYGQFLLSLSSPKAVEVYKTLTVLDPADPGTWTGLAFAYHLLFQNDTLARQALDRAYALNTRYSEALSVEGRIAEDAGAYDRARDLYQKAIDGEGAAQTAFLLLARLEEQQKNIPDAIRTLARAHGEFPNDAEVTRALGKLAPLVTVTQPPVEITAQRGAKVDVTWIVTGRDIAEYYDVLLAPEDGSWRILARDLGVSSRSYVWIIPDDVPDGRYRIVISARSPSLMVGAKGDGMTNGASPAITVGG